MTEVADIPTTAIAISRPDGLTNEQWQTHVDQLISWWAQETARLTAGEHTPCPSWCEAVEHTEHDTEHFHGVRSAALIQREVNVGGRWILEAPAVRIYSHNDEMEIHIDDVRKLMDDMGTVLEAGGYA